MTGLRYYRIYSNNMALSNDMAEVLFSERGNYIYALKHAIKILKVDFKSYLGLSSISRVKKNRF
jgi:hypothetical protein